MPSLKPITKSFARLRGVRVADETNIGLAAILGACVLNVAAASGFFFAHRVDPSFSAGAGIFVRILANFSCLLIPLSQGRALPRLLPWVGNRSLWLWGFFGVLTTGTYYLSIPLIGGGLSLFLNAGSGIFIVALAPLLTGQSSCWLHWLGALGSFSGLFLLSSGAANPSSALGYLLAIVSGLFGGLALLMVARRARKPYPTDTVMFHWTLVNFVACSGFLFFVSPTWPAAPGAWVALVLAGFAATASQFLTAYAYQRAPAALVACLTYCGPVLSVAVDAWVFGLPFTTATIFGAGLVLAFGLLLPLLRHRRNLRHQRLAR